MEKLDVISETGSVENPYHYAGYRYDQETGLYYLQSRYYNPEIGRFLTRDTFDGFDKEPLSQNKYIYGHNNPVMNIDPSGHISWRFFYYMLKGFKEVIYGVRAVIAGFFKYRALLGWILRGLSIKMEIAASLGQFPILLVLATTVITVLYAYVRLHFVIKGLKKIRNGLNTMRLGWRYR